MHKHFSHADSYQQLSLIMLFFLLCQGTNHVHYLCCAELNVHPRLYGWEHYLGTAAFVPQVKQAL